MLTETRNLKKLEDLMVLYGISCGHCEVSRIMGDSVYKSSAFQIKDDKGFGFI